MNLCARCIWLASIVFTCLQFGITPLCSHVVFVDPGESTAHPVPLLIMPMMCVPCFRMAEPRFNNPYFWPPPPSMPGQVSTSTTHNCRISTLIASSVSMCGCLFQPAPKNKSQVVKSSQVARVVVMQIKIFNLCLLRLPSCQQCVFVVFFGGGVTNDIHKRWLFSVEHDPLTLSAG